MKTKIVSLIFLSLCTFTFQTASAQESILMDSCASVSNYIAPRSENAFIAILWPKARPDIGLSCESIRSINNTFSIVNMMLIPAVKLIQNSTVSATLATDLAAAGVTFSNPVVLAVTVVGSVGIVTFHIVLRKSLEECEQQDREALKQQLLRDFEFKYGIAPATNVPFDFLKTDN